MKKFKYTSINQLKQLAKSIISKYEVIDSAVGVMFIDYTKDIVKVYPVVWVKDIDTLFFETSCGTGSASLTVLKSILKCKSLFIDILQPSGNIIRVETKYDMKLIEVNIYGSVTKDGVIRNLDDRTEEAN